MRLQPFREARHNPRHLTLSHWTAQGISEEVAKGCIECLARTRVFVNNGYVVHVDESPTKLADAWPDMIHLSIRRLDRKPIRDWRDLQQIKNLLVGAQHEGIEVFPAEERLVDTSNQYHLFVFKDPEIRVPFGFTDRLVLGPKDGPRLGNSKQRPLRDGVAASPMAENGETL